MTNKKVMLCLDDILDHTKLAAELKDLGFLEVMYLEDIHVILGEIEESNIEALNSLKGIWTIKQYEKGKELI